MEPEYKRAVRLTLEKKRLWAAGLLTALTLSEAWWILFGWGPESLGERAGIWVRGGGGRGAGDFILFILVALVSFVVLRALGYLGELVLVRQVAGAEAGEVPSFGDAFMPSRNRYLPFAATLLPWDALRVAVIYLPALIIAVWDRWDPRYNRLGLYLLAILIWLLILLAVFILAGITTTLAARFSLLENQNPPEAWLKGWALFRRYPAKCLAIWLQAVTADIIFLVLAWPISALVPWVVGLVVGPIGFAPLRWLFYLIGYAILAGGLVIGQAAVQCYKSSLWTVTFVEFREERGERVKFEEAPISPRPGRVLEPPPDFMPPS
jgi:hypothetical protein